MSPDEPLDEFVASVQPVVLVGGRSRRFGRDKLLEPMDGAESNGEVLVDRPLGVLREVFGARVAAVGVGGVGGAGGCDPRIAAKFDRCIDDRWPGAGPVAGILSALEWHGGPVFVLAGDMPGVTATAVRRIIERAATESARAGAVLAMTSEIQPCFGVYFPCARAALRRGIGAAKSRPLHEVLSELDVLSVDVAAREARNINTPADLRSQGGEPRVDR